MTHFDNNRAENSQMRVSVHISIFRQSIILEKERKKKTFYFKKKFVRGGLKKEIWPPQASFAVIGKLLFFC